MSRLDRRFSKTGSPVFPTDRFCIIEGFVFRQEQLHKGHLNKMDRNEKDNAKSVEEDDVAAVSRTFGMRELSVPLLPFICSCL